MGGSGLHLANVVLVDRLTLQEPRSRRAVGARRSEGGSGDVGVLEGTSRKDGPASRKDGPFGPLRASCGL